MEKEVIIQLKVQRPRDQAAWTETTRVAAALESKFKDVGAAGGKALSDAAAKAKLLASEGKKSGDAVSKLMAEIAKGNREAQGIDRLTNQLKALGVNSSIASDAAGKLFRRLGEGARFAEADIRRLAGALQTVEGGGGGGGRSGGFFRRFGGQLSGGRFAALLAGRNILGSANRAFDQTLATSADDQVQAMLSNPRMGGGAGGSFFGNIHSGIPVFSTVRDLLTHSDSFQRPLGPLTPDFLNLGRGSREGAAQSQGRLQRQITNAEFARERRQIISTGRVSEFAAQRQGFQDFSLAGIQGASGIIGARESVGQFRADRRFDALQQRLALQMEAVGRGESLGGGVIEALRGEIGNRPAFGGAERFRIGQERALAQGQLTAGRRAFEAAGAGGGDITTEQNAARQQMIEAQQRIVELERRDVELTHQAAEAEQQRLERFRQFAQTAEEGYRRIAQQERDRVSSFREQFGLMNELDRAQLQQLARRASGGGGAGIQGLSGEELQRLQGTGLFGEQVRAEAGRRAELSGIQGIIQASGVEGRITAAEGQQRAAAQIRTQIENQITVNMTASAEDMARQIAQQLQPAIAQLTVQIVAGVRAQLDDALAEAERQRALQNAQGRPAA